MRSTFYSLGYFPAPYKDELFYSLVGRFIQHTLSSAHLAKRIIFGSSDFRIPLRFPIRLSELVEHGAFTTNYVDKMVFNNTLLPYYLYFIQPERRKEIVENLWLGEKNWSIENALGLNRSVSKLENTPKYCPICIQENLRNYGEIYWNRLHQIPEIQICVKHNCFLEDCDKSNNSELIRKYPIYIPTIEICPIREPRYNGSELLLSLGKSCVNILNVESPINFEYASRVKAKGYVFGHGNNVDRISIEKAFNELYSEEIFSGIEYTSLLFNRYKITNPYKHVMFDYLLSSLNIKPGKTPELIKTKFWDKKYFGNGPWICINKSCKVHKRNKVNISKFNYDAKAKKTIGYLSCVCGTSYSMSFLIEDNKIKTTFIRKVFKPIAKSLNKPAINVIKKQLHTLREECFKLKTKQQLTADERRRVAYLSRLLKKSDTNWYDKISQRAKQIQLKNVKEVNSETRKNEFNRVAKVVSDFKLNPPKYRITAIKLARKAELSIKGLHRDVKRFLYKAEETVDEFQIRRLNYVAEEMKTNGVRITVSKLLFNAHIWKKSERAIQEAERICKRDSS